MRSRHLIAVLGAAALFAAPAFAMHPLATDDTGTQGKGAFLVESSVNYLKDNAYRSTAVPFVLTAGIGESMDIAVEYPYLWLDPSAATGEPESGFGDVVFKFKHRIYEDAAKDGEQGKSERSLAYQLAYSQPSGSEEKGLGAGIARWSARILGTTEMRETALSANVGYDSSGKALRRGNFVFDYAISLSVAAVFGQAAPWKPVLELAVLRVKGADGYGRIGTALAGIIYEPSERFYVDAGIRAGLNEQSEDYALLAGFGVKF